MFWALVSDRLTFFFFVFECDAVNVDGLIDLIGRRDVRQIQTRQENRSEASVQNCVDRSVKITLGAQNQQHQYY